MKRQKKLTLSLVGIVLFFAIGTVYFTTIDSSELTDEEIRISLRCNRITADYLITDYYCDNLQDYRKDLENDDLLKNDWSYEVGQQKLQRRGYND